MAVLLCCFALAAAAMPTEPELFASIVARIDLDHDGALSRAEYLHVDGSTNFDAMDADRDEIVSAAELGAWVKVTQPRPMDRPAAVGGTGLGAAPPPGAPPATGSFAPVATASTKSGVSPKGGASAVAASAAPSAADNRTIVRVAVLGGMLAVAGTAAWLMLRNPPRRRRR